MGNAPRSKKAKNRPNNHQEQAFHGLGVSPGVSVGPAYVRQHGTIDVPDYSLTSDQVSDEHARLEKAVERARRQMGRLRAKARKKARKSTKKGFVRRKVCRFCADSTLVLDYRDAKTLRLFISETGKMIPRRISGNCARHQRPLALAIKRARHLALLPTSANYL